MSDHLGYPSREFKRKPCRLGFQRDLFPVSVNLVSKRREILVYSSRNSYFWHIVAEIINKSILQWWGESREHGNCCQTSICSQTSPWCIMSTVPGRCGPGVTVLNRSHINTSVRRRIIYPELKGAYKDHQLNSWLHIGTHKIEILCLQLLSRYSSNPAAEAMPTALKSLFHAHHPPVKNLFLKPRLTLLLVQLHAVKERWSFSCVPPYLTRQGCVAVPINWAISDRLCARVEEE